MLFVLKNIGNNNFCRWRSGIFQQEMKMSLESVSSQDVLSIGGNQFLLFLASDANIPRNDSAANIINPVFMPEIKPGYVAGLMV